MSSERIGTDEYLPVTIETVDRAVMKWWDRKVDSHVIDPNSGGRRKIPVIFASGERAVMSSEKRGFRDKNGVLILPIITLARKDIDQGGNMSAMGIHVPTLKISRRVAQPKSAYVQNSIAARQAESAPAVYEITTIPFPNISTTTYEMTVQTQLRTQLNDVLEKLMSCLQTTNGVPSFVATTEENDFVYPGRSEPNDTRKPLTGFYFVGFFEPNMNDAGNFEEFTDQERICKYTTSFRIPTYLQLDPEGTEPAVKVQRSSYKLGYGSESCHFVDDPDVIQRIFFGKK